MSKIKVGDKVCLKNDNTQTGVVMSREKLGCTINGKPNIDYKYVVKFGEGFTNWGCFSKKELIRLTKNENKDNSYLRSKNKVLKNCKAHYFSSKMEDGRYITVCALDWFKYGSHTLFMGYSICAAEDTYDPKVGNEIAYRRAVSKIKFPLITWEQPQFSIGTKWERNHVVDNIIEDMMLCYFVEIKNNIEKYIDFKEDE